MTCRIAHLHRHTAGHWASSVLVMSLLLAGCDRNDSRGSDGTGRSPVHIVISGDTRGWIVPCGCTSGQSGGLSRRAALLNQRRTNAAVVYVDAGGAPAGTSAYEVARFDAIVQGEVAMGVAAHNLGRPEMELGKAALRRIAVERKVPFVATNCIDAVPPIARPYRLVNVSGRTLAFLGVISPDLATSDFPVRDPATAVLQTLDTLPDHVDDIIVLAWAAESELNELAAALPEVDAVIGGPTGQTVRPHSVGRVTVAAATNKGKYVVELWPAGAPSPDQHSSGLRPAESDPPVAGVAAAATGGTFGWDGCVTEVDDSLPEDTTQQQLLADFRNRLKVRNFTADETEFGPRLPATLPATWSVAGTDACLDCHGEDCDVWSASGHSHAWGTLQSSGAAMDPACQRCHTTSYGQPAGFLSARDSAARVNVGCESCHGPSAGHVADPDVATPFRSADRCVDCHDPENSPTFRFADYWERISH